ncbi:RagB/SusD family nutrient uptake outer membrane protein [Aliifodinibius salicampi]|uniref:RagB/SusD family nutrient uptake outer membrane protein n=1 Tax=Fodinibius salicampi TaxID=1920655 RepID=A0ABT3PWI3_9BACT|nr:RagB/SusD family nutrient uptake outer membrane protein [Fodinibius salicampi]MCW9712215.1 RagB/SusD family nutrient uptake outer membrane protein [Fodinibius salicampi]
MMNNSSIYIVLLAVILTSILAGCSDSFFVRPPQDQLTADNFYATETDLRMATAPLYNTVWFDYNDKASFTVGDARAGNMITTDAGYEQFLLFSITSGNDRLNEAWRSLYLAISQSNLTIKNIQQKAAGDISEVAKENAIAEARFMRGYAYSYLAQLWGAVPILTDPAKLIDQPNVRRNLTEDVYQFAINDFEYAAEHLPTTDDPGRVTQWSALGMLARLHHARAAFKAQDGGTLDQQDLDTAKEYARQVIEESGLNLVDNYANLFKLENENNQESLFALQWTYEGNTWGVQNTTQAYFAAEAALTGVGDGWGGGTGVSAWLLQQYNPDDQRRKATFMLNGDHYPELMQEEGGYTYEGTGASGPGSAIKKYIIGRPSDNDGRVGFMRTGINTYMLRLAEVYLIYAQAELGNQESTSDSQALQYFNAVRNRAGLDSKTTITHRDILLEKWKELAYEGQNWFQLVRWHYYEPDAVLQFIDDQERNMSFEYTQGGDTTYTAPPTNITAEHSDFNLPYPEADIVQNPNLMEEPVPYDFLNEEGTNEANKE